MTDELGIRRAKFDCGFIKEKRKIYIYISIIDFNLNSLSLSFSLKLKKYTLCLRYTSIQLHQHSRLQRQNDIED